MDIKYSISPLKASILFLIAALITIVGGVFIGIITNAVGSILYIVLISPVMVGIVGGYIVKFGVRIAKIRNLVRVAILVGLVAAAIYGTYHYSRYIHFRSEAFDELAPKLTKVSGVKKMEAVDLLIDLSLEKETGHTGFLGYMLYRAKRGVSIGRFYSGNGLNLGPIFSWIYWMLEFAIIFWVAMSMGKKTSQTPICESCGSWYGPEEHMGGTSVMNERIVLDLIHRRDFAELGKLLERNASIPSTELYIKRCKRCGKGQSFITIQRASQGTTGRLQLIGVTNLTLQANDSSQLLQYVRVD
jgi:hypothetical protein